MAPDRAPSTHEPQLMRLPFCQRRGHGWPVTKCFRWLHCLCTFYRHQLRYKCCGRWWLQCKALSMLSKRHIHNVPQLSRRPSAVRRPKNCRHYRHTTGTSSNG